MLGRELFACLINSMRQLISNLTMSTLSPIGEYISMDVNSLRKILNTFSEHQVDFGLISPTKTGLEKGILDATIPVRDYLARENVHDYDAQGQGQDCKVVLKAYFVDVNEQFSTSASLYRPATKQGDPRIWFSRLRSYAEPNDLLAIVHAQGDLYVVNCTARKVAESAARPSSPLSQLLTLATKQNDPVLMELLGKLKEISSRGYLPSIGGGDSGVGLTLESELGIKKNSSKQPDYHGIEIKASRKNRNANRVNLFSRVPNWKLSPIGSASNLLDAYGYMRDGKQKLYHTIVSGKKNSIGFHLIVDQVRGLLKQYAGNVHLVTWELNKLREALEQKHSKTMWVKAEVNIDEFGRECFHFTSARFTYGPLLSQFDRLLKDGNISVDFTLSSNGTRTRDHGYLFKINPANLDILFPPPIHYDLTSTT